MNNHLYEKKRLKINRNNNNICSIDIYLKNICLTLAGFILYVIYNIINNKFTFK